MKTDFLVTILIEFLKEHPGIPFTHILIDFSQQTPKGIELQVALPLFIAVDKELVNIVDLFVLHDDPKAIGDFGQFLLEFHGDLVDFVFDCDGEDFFDIAAVH